MSKVHLLKTLKVYRDENGVKKIKEAKNELGGGDSACGRQNRNGSDFHNLSVSDFGMFHKLVKNEKMKKSDFCSKCMTKYNDVLTQAKELK